MSTKPKILSSRCLFCNGELEITRLRCGECNTQIESTLPIPSFFRLPHDLQDFVLVFLRCRGNIREAEKELGISYPTVCKRLDLVNELLGNSGPNSPEDAEAAPDPAALARKRNDILQQVENGTLTAKQAAQLLREKP